MMKNCYNFDSLFCISESVPWANILFFIQNNFVVDFSVSLVMKKIVPVHVFIGWILPTTFNIFWHDLLQTDEFISDTVWST